MSRTRREEPLAYVDPLSLDVEPFDMGIIPFSRPVCGLDLENLRMHLGLKISDMIWLMGMNTQSWYSHTTDAVAKLSEKVLREHGRIEEDIMNSEADKVDLRESISEATAAEKKSITAKIAKLDEKIAKLKPKLAAAVVSPAALAKAEKEKASSEAGPTKPLKGTLALLVRFYDAYNDYIDEIRMRSPSIHDFQEAFPSLQAKEIGELLGRDTTAAYRWLEFQAEPHPSAKRLIDALMKWIENEPTNDFGVNNIETWKNTVRREWALRGWEMGKVRNPSRKTMAGRRPMGRRGAKSTTTA